ncbi:MAG: LPS assembly lipoprotein LptE [Bryobacteraceae bacterium]
MISKGLVIAMVGTLLSACGYHVAGQGDLLPKTITTICIPAFTNATSRYKLTDQLPEAITREFAARTRYKIISDPNTADVVLKGSVNNYVSFTTVVDEGTTANPGTGRASAVDFRVYLNVSLVERTTGKVLFTRPNFEVRERYEVSVQPGPYFDESDAALQRASKTVAQQLVGAILDNF